MGAPNLNNPNYTFLWQDGTTTPGYEITTAGTYTVEVDFGNCFDVSTVVIDVFPELEPPVLEPAYVLCGDLSVDLVAETPNASSYLWSTGETSSSIEIREEGTYNVSISDTCSTIDVAFDVIREDIDELQPLFVPTAFTPNSDGVNDIFRPITAEGPEGTGLEFSVFNRWGDRVFYSDNLSRGWSGRVSSEMAEMGVYAWIYKLQGPSCEGEIEIQGQGNVTVIY